MTLSERSCSSKCLMLFWLNFAEYLPGLTKNQERFGLNFLNASWQVV